MSNHNLEVIGLRKRSKGFKGDKNTELFTEDELGETFDKKGDLIVKGTLNLFISPNTTKMTTWHESNVTRGIHNDYTLTEIFLEKEFCYKFIYDAVDGNLNASTVAANQSTSTKPIDKAEHVSITGYFVISQNAQRFFFQYYNTEDELMDALENGYYDYELND